MTATLLRRSSFADADLAAHLGFCDDAELDALDFGVIAFDARGIVTRYNRFESEAAGLARASVIDHHIFEKVAPCMNNRLVARRFENATSLGEPLDMTIDYVLTLRMQPAKVRLRLLSDPATALRHVLVERRV